MSLPHPQFFYPYADPPTHDIDLSPAFHLFRHPLQPQDLATDRHTLGLGPPPSSDGSLSDLTLSPLAPGAIPLGLPGSGGIPHPLVPPRTTARGAFLKGLGSTATGAGTGVGGARAGASSSAAAAAVAGGLGPIRSVRPSPKRSAGHARSTTAAAAGAGRASFGAAGSTSSAVVVVDQAPAGADAELDYVVSPSCAACRRAKKGCLGGTPCSRCDKLGAKCVYLVKIVRRGRASGAGGGGGGPDGDDAMDGSGGGGGGGGGELKAVSFAPTPAAAASPAAPLAPASSAGAPADTAASTSASTTAAAAAAAAEAAGTDADAPLALPLEALAAIATSPAAAAAPSLPRASPLADMPVPPTIVTSAPSPVDPQFPASVTAPASSTSPAAAVPGSPGPPLSQASEASSTSSSASSHAVDPNPPFPPLAHPAALMHGSADSLAALDVLADASAFSPPAATTPLARAGGLAFGVGGALAFTTLGSAARQGAPLTDAAGAGGATGAGASASSAAGKSKFKKPSSGSSGAGVNGGGGGAGAGGGGADEPPKIHRNRQARTLRDPACTACRSLKKKCPGGAPCAPCARAGRECVYKCGVPARSRKRKGESATVVGGGVGGAGAVKVEGGAGGPSGAYAYSHPHPAHGHPLHMPPALVDVGGLAYGAGGGPAVDHQGDLVGHHVYHDGGYGGGGSDYRSSDEGDYELDEDGAAGGSAGSGAGAGGGHVYDPALMEQTAAGPSSAHSDAGGAPLPSGTAPAAPQLSSTSAHPPTATPVLLANGPGQSYGSAIPPVPIQGAYAGSYPPFAGGGAYGYHPILPSASQLYQPSPSNVRSD